MSEPVNRDYRCKLCGYRRGDHKSETLNCPACKGRIPAFPQFNPKQYFEWDGVEPKARRILI